MFIFTRYDEKQASFGTQQDLNLDFSHYSDRDVCAEVSEWFGLRAFFFFVGLLKKCCNNEWLTV